MEDREALTLASRTSRRPGRTREWVALVVGMCCLAVGGFTLTAGSAPARDVGAVPSAAVVSLPASPSVAARTSAPRPTTRLVTPVKRAQPAAPVGLKLLRLGISAPVVPVGVDAKGALGVPEDPNVLGWWRGGAAVRSGRGTIAIDGHLDSIDQGIGFFARLRELKLGDRVQLDVRAGTPATYVVTARRNYPRDELPRSVFARNVQERLVLITCGGRWDAEAKRYTDNVVLYAVPAA